MRVAKNTFFQIVSSILTVAAAFVLTTVIARTGGVGVLGRYSAVVVFAAQFAFACDLGLNQLLVPRIARYHNQAPQLLSNALAVSLVLSLVAFGVILASSELLGYSTQGLYPMALASLGTILSVLLTLFSGVFFGLERMEYNTLAVLVEKVVLLAGVGVIVAAHLASLDAFLWLLILSRAVALAFSAGLYHRSRLGWAAIDPSSFKPLLAQALPFGLNILLSNVYLQSDVVLLAFFRGETDVGFYKAANTFFFPLIIIAAAFNNSLLPILARAHGTQRERQVYSLQKSFHYLFALGFPMAVGLYAIAPFLLPAVFGREYAASAPALRLLSWALPLRFVNQTLAMMLTSINQQGRRTRAVAVGAAFNLLANAMLLPRWGFVGAGLTTVLTETVVFALLYAWVSQEVARPALWPTAWRVALSSTAILAVAWALGGQRWLATVALAPLAYGLALYALGGLPRADLAMLAAMIRRPVAKEVHADHDAV